MSQGGELINQRTEQIIRYSMIATPVALLLYGFLVMFRVVNSSHFICDRHLYILLSIWIVVAAYHYLFPTMTKRKAALLITAYHVLATVYILIVSGFAIPLLVVWILLMLATYSYFGKRGCELSIAGLIIAVLVDILFHTTNASIIVVDLVSLLAVSFAGIGVVSITHAKTVDASELERSKELENLQRDRIMTIVNNLADAIISTNENGSITVYNAATLALLDTNQTLDNQPIGTIVKLLDSDKKPFDITAALHDTKTVTTRDDLFLPIGDDESLRFEVILSPIHSSAGDNQTNGYVIIMRDITKAKSLEEERDEFISVVSHELRTPITIAEGSVSNLQLMNERGILTKDKTAAVIKSTHDQILFLASMVNDLSTLSRAERGAADNPEPIDVRAMVNDLYNQYLPESKDRGLHFNLDTAGKLGTVLASRLYLQELIQNFITNALKYTKEGSVTFEAKRKGDTVEFTVRDTGIGMAKSDQAKIFDKFYRAEDYRTRETNGTGLGLYVSAKLAKKLGTKIELSSRLNHGSSFSFSLPVEDTAKK
ncbi:MAG TPA: ATP-binding protein [Candidatus Saccharimonadaceae bacterium]|nr:ATP-binding protein [Candidatus Saccharimonadaceae bacterium]